MDEHEWWIEECGGDAFSHGMAFSDEIANEREDLVSKSETFLNGLPGVSAEHVDREFIMFQLTSMTTEELKKQFTIWWNQVRSEKTTWQVDIDSLAKQLAVRLKQLGFKKRRWVFNRRIDDEIVHVIELVHVFGRNTDEHEVLVCGGVYVAPVERLRYDSSKDPAFVNEPLCTLQNVFSRLFPLSTASLDVLTDVEEELAVFDRCSSLDELITRWERGELFEEWKHSFFTVDRSHALALVAKDRFDDAHRAFQTHYEEVQPCQRPHILAMVDRLPIESLQTSAHPSITREEFSMMTKWSEGTPARLAKLDEVFGSIAQPKRSFLRRTTHPASLDLSRRSLDVIWRWLSEHDDAIFAALSGETPNIDTKFLGATRAQVASRWQEAVEPMLVLTELLATHVAAVVAVRNADVRWSIEGDGALGLAHLSSAGLLDRVAGKLDDALLLDVAPTVANPLAELAVDMERWIHDSIGLARTAVFDEVLVSGHKA